MSAEIARTLDFPWDVHAKLAKYLLTRDRFGIGDTGTPNDGLYVVRDTPAGKLKIDTHFATQLKDPRYGHTTVHAHRAALMAGEAPITANLEDISEVLFFTPNSLRRSMLTDAMEMLHGINVGQEGMIAYTARDGIISNPVGHPVMQELFDLPLMSGK